MPRNRHVHVNTEVRHSGSMSVTSQLALDEAVAKALQYYENKLAATRQDDIDPDDMNYEELQALGEAIGAETRGLSDELISFLTPSMYATGFVLRDEHAECVICCMPYEDQAALITLPCEHHYHSDCIRPWLKINKACPICGEEVFG
ncbi:unnamed protein product [Spirodela intermedia]|uniref:RING-type domain-containing protein n=1 Tax=Spirodela intermedia TaxID=51605 RepID=A0A7I8KPU5_SPIIN|nr:unnamed protein product [Spirodela intermedia]